MMMAFEQMKRALQGRRIFFTPAFYDAVTRPCKITFGNNSEHVASEKLLLSFKKEAHNTLKALVICGGGGAMYSVSWRIHPWNQ